MDDRAKVTSNDWPPSNAFDGFTRKKTYFVFRAFGKNKKSGFSLPRAWRLLRVLFHSESKQPPRFQSIPRLSISLVLLKLSSPGVTEMSMEGWVMAAKEELYSKVTPRRQRQNRPGTVKHGSSLDVLLSMGFPKTRAWVWKRHSSHVWYEQKCVKPRTEQHTW